MAEDLHIEESTVYETPLLSDAGEFAAKTEGEAFIVPESFFTARR